MSEITRQIMKIAVAQICQNVGWNTAHTTPLEILNDIGQRYLQELCKATHDYSNQYGRTEPTLDDLGLAFNALGINLPDLADYINNVESVPFAYTVPPFPLSHPNNLSHPKPGSRELLQRPEHIHEHLPPIHPEIEEEEALAAKAEARLLNGDAGSPPGKHPLLDASFEELPASKKPRLGFDEDEGGRPMREVTSVFMTPSGFISPNREGRLPAPGIPLIQDTPPHSPISHQHNPIKKMKESKKDKSGKKKDKNGHKKDGKKIKSSKKENKENSHLKLDKHISPSALSKESSPSKPKKTKSKSPSKSGSSKKKKDKEKKKSKSSKEKSKSKVPKSPSSASMPSASLSSPKTVKDLFSMHLNPPSSQPPAHLTPSAKTPDNVQSTVSPVRTLSPPKHPSPIKPEVPSIKKEPVSSPKVEVVAEKPSPVKIEQPYSNYSNSNDSSEEFPEPRLVIDDSIETAERQEKEQRLAGLDECIDAVIQRAVGEAEKEEELSFKDDDEVNDTFITFGPHVKLEPKDVYDFTDTSSDSSRAPTPKSMDRSESPSKAPSPEPPPPPPPPPEVEETPPKKTKEKKKSKKKAPKSSITASAQPPPPPPSTLFIPSPKAIVKPAEKVRPHIYTDSEDSSSSDVPMSPKSTPSTPHLSSSPFSFNSTLSSRTLSHSFPTPPLFVTSESSSHPSSIKTLAEKKAMPSPKTVPPDPESKFDSPVKEEKKEKKQKVVKKEKGKKKAKVKVKEKEVKPKVVEVEEEKPKVKEKPEKPKPEKKAKVEKKKAKEPEEKSPKKEAEEGAKLTLKWGSSSSKSGSKRASPNAPTKSPTATPPPTPSKLAAATPPPPPPVAPPPKPPPPVAPPTPTSGRGRAAGRGKGKKSVPSKTAVITETLGTSVDADGNKIWICPACTHVDDGSPMIGCDECDDWYHWLCVNIIVPPKEEESWYCPRCLSKRTPPLQKRKKKRHRKDR